jgi:hypothetical protein
MIHGLWIVTSGSGYRGHEYRDEFEATLEDSVAARAIMRGSIKLLKQFEPGLPDEWALPKGWLV